MALQKETTIPYQQAPNNIAETAYWKLQQDFKNFSIDRKYYKSAMDIWFDDDARDGDDPLLPIKTINFIILDMHENIFNDEEKYALIKKEFGADTIIPWIKIQDFAPEIMLESDPDYKSAEDQFYTYLYGVIKTETDFAGHDMTVDCTDLLD